jgi:type II secretory pathway pseudopilin PulG
MFQFQKKKRPGISLIEVLVVLAILVFLLGWLLTSVRSVRKAAAQSVCHNNLRQMCLGTIECADANASKLPPLVGSYPGEGQFSGKGTVFFHILPYIEQDTLYKASLDGEKHYSVWNASTFSKEIKVYTCPDDPSAPEDGRYKGWLATSSYAGNFLVFGDPVNKTLQGRNRFPASIPDGTSNTIMFSERYQMCKGTPCAWGYAGDTAWAPVFAYFSQGKFQTAPTQAECNPSLAQSAHPQGITVGMCDGSSRTVSRTISPLTWWHACTPAGGEVLGADW